MIFIVEKQLEIINLLTYKTVLINPKLTPEFRNEPFFNELLEDRKFELIKHEVYKKFLDQISNLKSEDMKEAFIDEGVMVNSEQFNGQTSNELVQTENQKQAADHDLHEDHRHPASLLAGTAKPARTTSPCRAGRADRSRAPSATPRRSCCS